MNVSGSADFQTDPVFGTLRVAGGTRWDAAPCAVMMAPPPRVARGRADERLFILLDLTGPVTPHLYREMREVVAQEYWSTSGSVTAAMRQAAAAANRHLFQFNLSVDSSNRCYGGLICAVLHGEDIFIVHAGPGRACVLRRNQFDCFPRGGELPHLGMGVVADVRLYHAFAAVGDTLLLASSSLARAAGDAGLARVLPRADVDEVLTGLEQVGAGVDFIALVARLVLPAPAPRAVATPRASVVPSQPTVAPPQPEVPADRETSWRSISARVTEGLQRTRSQTTRAEPLDLPPAPVSKPPVLPEPARKPGSALGERVWKDVQVVGRGFGERVKDGARTVGHAIVAAGAAVAAGARALFHRILPGAERGAQRQARQPRPVPKENRVVMMGVAIGIPILMGIFVLAVWFTSGKQAQFESLITLAEAEKQQAQTTNVVSETRKHWDLVLDYTRQAANLQPGSPAIAELQEQALKAIDELDGIVRLAFVELGNFGEGSALRQLVVHGQTIFILDPAAGWVAQVNFNLTDDGIVVPDEAPSVFVKTGLEVDGGTVGSLVDFAWVESGSGRMASGLVILDEDGGIVSYDPAWGSEAGEPHLTRSLLGMPPRVPRAIDSFDGRFYVLDSSEEQIWRYDPQGDLYPNRPSPYFVVSPARPLGDAIDMAIDANVYVLYAGGAIEKYLSGEPQSFDTGGVPEGFTQPIALTVDPDSDSGRVYVADAGGKRVVVLEADGAFCAQFRTDEAFDALEALAVDEAASRFYVFSGGRLYVAPLPRLP
jgi:hypothetical protein